ncbi:hypothetical protein [Pararhodonellum marinum]|uniref:hypothetical protein n=1 Tax=Pararhodonellum marinum TaxID=2755358 RepID=UPI001E566268|nr:hypothetical protein [Pararhodonellum marinum]
MNFPLLNPELVWMLTGERLAEGYTMYTDVIDDNGPFSVTVYWLLHELFGRSYFIYKLLAFLLILFQTFYVNQLFIRYKSFELNTYIPALVMIVLFHLSFDFFTLSPALMGTTFIVLALGQLFSQTVLQQQGTDSVLLAGLFGGAAACFHFPLIVFLPFLVFAGIAVSGFSFNQLILSLVGYVQPFLICGIYYYWKDGLDNFLYEFVFATRVLEAYKFVTFLDIVLLFAIPGIFVVIGFFLGTVLKSITVNQQKQKQLILIFLIFALFSVFLSNRRTPYQWMVLLPGLTYFISQVFLFLQKQKLQQILFWFFFLGTPMVGYIWAYQNIKLNPEHPYVVKSGSQYDFTAGERVLVLGNDLAYYRKAKLGGPFLNYNLSKRVLLDFESLQDMSVIYRYMMLEKPRFIIDEEGTFERMMERIQPLQDLYQKKSPGIYEIIP